MAEIIRFWAYVHYCKFANSVVQFIILFLAFLLARIQAFFIRTSKLSAESGLFLIFWRFRPQIVLKLFLFPGVSKQCIRCPEQYKAP